MKRLQLIEIHDQPWCPRTVRDGVTDFLQQASNRWGYFSSVVPTLCHFIDRMNPPRVIDLCSGGSGPWLRICRMVAGPGMSFRVVLTDKYPNLTAFRQARERSGGCIDFLEEPVDARALPRELAGFRTLFTSFHHFPPYDAREILQDAVNSRQGIGIFEMTDRDPRTILHILAAPFFVLLLTPSIRPFRWSRLLLTYLFPIIPLVVLIDGIVSCLRTYSLPELEELTASLEGDPYDWEIRRIRSVGAPFPVLYAIGCPQSPVPDGEV